MNRLDKQLDDYFSTGKYRNVIDKMNQAYADHLENLKKTREEYKHAVKKMQKVYLKMKKNNLSEYEDEDVLVYMDKEGHVIGKVDDLYFTTTNENDSMLLEFTGKAYPDVENKFVDHEYKGEKIKSLAKFIYLKRTCMRLEIDENGKFCFLTNSMGNKNTIKDVYISEINLGGYIKSEVTDERKNELADALEEELKKSLPVKIEAKLQEMKTKKKESSNKK